MQFWGSEQYLRDITLNDTCSYFLNPRNSIFSKKEIEIFKRKANELNLSKEGDSAGFYLKKCSSR